MVVSIGVKNIQYKAAHVLAPTVLIKTGKFLVDSFEFIKDMNRVLEKVSPNLDNGPYMIATEYPL